MEHRAFVESSTSRVRIAPSSFPILDDSATVFTVDNTDPVTTLTIDPIDGLNGWYITVPAMSLLCADTGERVATRPITAGMVGRG